jgi:hypothetical protein
MESAVERKGRGGGRASSHGRKRVQSRPVRRLKSVDFDAKECLKISQNCRRSVFLMEESLSRIFLMIHDEVGMIS